MPHNRAMGLPVRGDFLAAYGELLSRLDAPTPQELSGQLDGLLLRGSCWIPGILYDLGDYPGLVPGDGQVLGELYEITAPDLFEELDPFERGRQPEPEYVRRRIALIEPEIEAWVYMYDHDPAARPRIASGDWRGHLAERMRLR